jgi:N-acetylglucosaminyl-diphospho-decaprenol L-rhamnosyltransferase
VSATDADPGPGSPARWAAVVVSYNYGDVLEPCVRSIFAENSAGAPAVVIVDNGSTDGSIERVRDAFADARVMVAPANVGYARAANLGISRHRRNRRAGRRGAQR